jgi:hypothetical protein
MLWIIENKRLWRGIIVGLLLIALMGPWVFDIIHLPGEGPCSASWIRLAGNFCGEPLSVIWILTCSCVETQDWFFTSLHPARSCHRERLHQAPIPR